MKFQEMIKEKAEELIKEIENISPIENHSYLTFHKIEYGLIEYQGGGIVVMIPLIHYH